MACRQCADDVSWCGQHTHMCRWHADDVRMTCRRRADDVQTTRGRRADDVQTTCRRRARDARCSTAWNSATQARQLCIKPKMASLFGLQPEHEVGQMGEYLLLPCIIFFLRRAPFFLNRTTSENNKTKQTVFHSTLEKKQRLYINFKILSYLLYLYIFTWNKSVIYNAFPIFTAIV